MVSGLRLYATQKAEAKHGGDDALERDFVANYLGQYPVGAECSSLRLRDLLHDLEIGSNRDMLLSITGLDGQSSSISCRQRCGSSRL